MLPFSLFFATLCTPSKGGAALTLYVCVCVFRLEVCAAATGFARVFQLCLCLCWVILLLLLHKHPGGLVFAWYVVCVKLLWHPSCVLDLHVCLPSSSRAVPSPCVFRLPAALCCCPAGIIASLTGWTHCKYPAIWWTHLDLGLSLFFCTHTDRGESRLHPAAQQSYRLFAHPTRVFGRRVAPIHAAA